MSSDLKIVRTKEVKAALGPEAFLIKRGRKNLAAGVPLEDGGYRAFILLHIDTGFDGMPVDHINAKAPEDLFGLVEHFYKDET